MEEFKKRQGKNESLNYSHKGVPELLEIVDIGNSSHNSSFG